MNWSKLRERREQDLKCYYVIISGDKEYNGNSYSPILVDDKVSMASNKDIMYSYLDRLLEPLKTKYEKIKIVTGDNRGVEALAQDYGLEHDIDVVKFEADWEGDGNRAGYIKNENMFFYAGWRAHKAAILFWNGTNTITESMFFNAYMQNIAVRVFNYSTHKWLSPEEIGAITNEVRQRQSRFL